MAQRKLKSILLSLTFVSCIGAQAAMTPIEPNIGAPLSSPSNSEESDSDSKERRGSGFSPPVGQCSVPNVALEIEKMEQSGLPEDQFRLGLYYLATEKNAKKAIEWFKKSANQGEVSAQMVLYEIYSNGEIVKTDLKQAAMWLEKAANNDSVISQAMLGILYENGEGVKKDRKLALQWYERAASAGEVNAARHVGSIYQEGKWVKKNETQAYIWYSFAAKVGDEEAVPFVEELAAKLKPEQIEAADAQAQEMIDKAKIASMEKFFDKIKKAPKPNILEDNKENPSRKSSPTRAGTVI